MRFLHSADLHIDRSFEGIQMLSDKVKEQLPAINRKVLQKLVDTALEQEVDFVLLAGDTFHQARPSLRIQHDFFQEISRLAVAEIPVYMIFGNHDYYDSNRYWFDFPENVVLFPSETVETIRGVSKNGETYAISGFSYQQPWITTNKVSEFPSRLPVDYHIGMYHGDNGEHYAPFSVSEMKQKGYDYWALGHIHVPKILSEEPMIVYPGTPQGRTQKEQETGVIIATLNGQGVEIQSVDLAEITWAHLEISLASCKNQREILQKILSEVKTNQPRLMKLLLTGTSQLASEWFSETEKNEMMAYLNEQLAKEVTLQTIYAIDVKKSTTEKIPLAVPESYVAQLLDIYQEPTIFADGLKDLLQHPLIHRGINQEAFQTEVLQQTKDLLENDFQWEEQK
jgi:exonuclease SbcD